MIKLKRKILLILILLLIKSSNAVVLDTLIVEDIVVNNKSAVRRVSGLRSGKRVDAVDIQKAIKNIYNMGGVKDVDFSAVSRTDTSVSLKLTMEEYPVCDGVEFEGNDEIKDRKFRDSLDISKGMPVSDQLMFKTKKSIKDMYAEEGYINASVEHELIQKSLPEYVIVKFKIDEGKRARVRNIIFKGNEAFSDFRLKRKFKTDERHIFSSGDFDREEYPNHLDTLMLYYKNNGYLDASVVRDSIWYTDEGSDINIEIEIDEGIKYYAGDVFIQGNNVVSEERLLSSVSLDKGGEFSLEDYEKTMRGLGSVYRNEGYLWVDIEEERDIEEDTIDLTFNITEGKPAIIKKIKIKGNTKTRDKVIRRELNIYPGDKYRQSKIQRSVRDIMQLDFFKPDIRPNMEMNDDGTINLVLNVSEKDNIGQFKMGVTFSQVDKFGGNLSVSIPNFRGAGEKLDATVEFSANRQHYSLGFMEPWVFNTPTSLNARGFYEKYKTEFDDYRSSGIELGVGRRLTWPDDYFKVYSKYRLSFEKDSRYNEGQDTLSNHIIKREGLLSRLSLTLSRNSTDMPQFPNTGSKMSLTGHIAGLGGDYEYVKGVLKYDWYFPLFWKFVMGIKSQFGLVGSIGEYSSVAVTDLFAVGGVYYDGQLRGYPEGMLGRYSSNPELGTSMFTVSGELRFPVLPQQLYLAGFMDVGNTWRGIKEVDFSDMYKGVGVGVRLMLPMVGLMGFDFAWGLDDPSSPHYGGTPHGFELHFLMNQGF
ncbi:MAG: outer membrane protein assembly factor BamA [Chitinivibrionales bacterium]